MSILFAASVDDVAAMCRAKNAGLVTPVSEVVPVAKLRATPVYCPEHLSLAPMVSGGGGAASGVYAGGVCVCVCMGGVGVQLTASPV